MPEARWSRLSPWRPPGPGSEGLPVLSKHHGEDTRGVRWGRGANPPFRFSRGTF